MLASRARYALVWTGISVAIMLGATALSGEPFPARYWMLATPVILFTCLVNAAVAYPRAKRRFTARAR